MNALNVRLVLACSSVLFFGFLPHTTAQEPFIDAYALLLRGLDREANLGLSGTVTETQLFPPRKTPQRQYQGELPAPPPVVVELLRSNYRANLEPGEVIAGRATWLLSLSPTNSEAPEFRVWFDRTWGVRLAVEQRNGEGTLTHSARFVQLAGSPTPRPERLAVVLSGLSLPAGFRWVGLARRGDAQDRLELRASNGLAVLVLSLAPRQTAPGLGIAQRRFRTGTWLWVVGNLTTASLERLTASASDGLDVGAAIGDLAAELK
jgi:hypothetical protein